MGSPISPADVLNVCKYVYTVCDKYKNAVDEFGEIAEKADSTYVVLKNLREEEKKSGSLVERAGRPAHDQLQRYLRSLDKDLEKLEKLVKKYDLIHNEGPGRRLLWALWESDSLTELRRQIGYHEQTLQLWYMHLIGGSLRRLESNTEDIMDIIKKMPAALQRNIEEDLRKFNDPEALIEALKKHGVKDQDIKTNLGTAINYVEADEPTRHRMETTARLSSSYVQTPDSPASKDKVPQRSRSSRKAGDSKLKSSSRRRKEDNLEKPIIFVNDEPHSKSRKKSTRDEHYDNSGDHPKVIVETQPSGHQRRASESYVVWPEYTRRKSYTPSVTHLSPRDAVEHTMPRSRHGYAESPGVDQMPFRSKSSQPHPGTPEVIRMSSSRFKVDERPVSTRRQSDTPVVIRTTSPYAPGTRREEPRESEYLAVGGHRASDGAESRHRRSRSSSDVVIVTTEHPRGHSEGSWRARRHSEDRDDERSPSTRSYTRERRPRSRGSQHEDDRSFRKVSTLDRIDSVPLSEEDKVWERRHERKRYDG